MGGADALLSGPTYAMFCIGLTQEFFSLPNSEVPKVGGALKAAFDDLGGRFGIRVIGTFDDDLTQVGVTTDYPWTSVILAEVPDLKAVVEVTNLLREPCGDYRLVKYFRIDARIGRELFFGTK